MAKTLLNVDTATVTRNLRIVRTEGLREFGAAMFDEIEETETPECIARTPIKTGALRASEKTTGPVYGPKTIKVGTSAGGPGVDYAIKVHEDTEAYHPVGQAKFIESTYRDSAPFILGRVAKRIDLGKLVTRKR